MSVRSAGEIFGEAETLALYLGIEVALAHAQAEVGVIPEDAAREIERGATLDAIDVPRVRQEAQRTGYAVAPLVRQLTEACGDAGRFVHWGATTQDIVNTALALQVDEAFRGVLERVERLARALAALVRSHRHSVMAGRTFGGHALPIVGDVRGEGYFYGIELVKDKATKESFNEASRRRCGCRPCCAMRSASARPSRAPSRGSLQARRERWRRCRSKAWP